MIDRNGGRRRSRTFLAIAIILGLAALAPGARAQHGGAHGGGAWHGGGGHSWHGAPAWHGGWGGGWHGGWGWGGGGYGGWYGPRVGFGFPFFFPPYYAAPPVVYPPAVYPAPPVGPYPAPALPAPANLPSYDVYFALGSDRLTGDAHVVIEEAAAAFKTGAVSSVAVIGHTDSSGDAVANFRLSERRAAAVTAALIRAGVLGNAIVMSGRGEGQPRVPTPKGVSEPENRRVTIVLGGGGPIS